MKRKGLSWFLVVVMVASLLTACSSGTDSSSSVSEEPETSAASSSESSDTSEGADSEGGLDTEAVLTWAMMPLSEGDARTLQEDWGKSVVEKFKEQTGITVNIEWLAWADYMNKHLTNIASKSGPDVIHMGSTTYPVIMEAGGLVDMEPYLEGFGGTAAFYDSALFYCKDPEGRIMCLPWGGGARVYYYRKDLYDQAGLEYPTSDWKWSDMVDQLEILTESLGKPAFLTPGSSGDVAYYFWSTLEANNGKTFNEDYTQSLFNDAIGVKTVKQITDLYSNGLMPSNFYEYAFGEIMAAFVNGEVALAVGTDGWMPQLDASPIADLYGTVPPPRGEDGTFKNIIIPSCLGIASYSPYPDETAALLQLILNKEENINMAQACGWLPFRKDALEDPVFDTPQRQAFIFSIENGGAYFPQHPKSAAMRDTTTNYLREIYAKVIQDGTVDEEFIQSTLDKCAEEIHGLVAS